MSAPQERTAWRVRGHLEAWTIELEYQAPFSAYRPDGDGTSRNTLTNLSGTGYGHGDGNALTSAYGDGLSDDDVGYAYNERHGIYGGFWRREVGEDD